MADKTLVRLRESWKEWPRSSIFFLLAVLSVGAGLVFYRKSLLPAHTIQHLAELPVGDSATIIGSVTGADFVGHRFWVQDKTGALLIDRDPGQFGLHSDDTIALTGVKTQHYDPSKGFSSVKLENLSAKPIKSRLQLPPPFVVSLWNFPGNEKTGLRLRLTGIVRAVTRDDYGRAQLSMAETGQEITAILPQFEDQLAQLVNTSVNIVGVGEDVRNPQGALITRYLWVRNAADIQRQEAVPPQPRLYSVRDLYREIGSSDGHLLRFRGRVAAVKSPNVLLLEDRWGTVRCQFSQLPPVKPNAAVEIAGFPTVDGLRIDLFHCVLKQTLTGISDETDPPQLRVLTSVNAVRALPEADARLALPVRLHGVITYNDSIWRQLFLQDSTGGIYVKYADAAQPLHAGDEVTVTGLSNPGNFAPIVVAPKFQVHGIHPLPAAKVTNPRDAASGILDSQYVQVEGIVHPIREGQELQHLTFELYSSIGQIHVFTSQLFAASADWQKLQDATVRIRGVFGTVFNSRRQLVGYQLSTSSPNDVQIIEPSPEGSSSADPTPIGNLLRFSPQSHIGHRVKVRGSATMISRGVVYIQDPTGGVQVHADVPPLQLGDLVEAVGYASAGLYSPILNDATIQPTGANRLVQPFVTTADSLLRGQFDSQLVSVEGRVLAVIDSPTGKSLVMQSGSVTFYAQFDTAEIDYPADLQPGAVFRLSGVCTAQVDPSRFYVLLWNEPVSFKLMLRTPADLTLLHSAPWWTTGRAIGAMALLSLLVLFVVVWASILKRRVHIQRNALKKAAETTQAIADLVRAMREVSVQQDFNSQVSVRGSEPIAGLVIQFNDMLRELQLRDRAKRDAEGKLQHQALTDELTGLPNRRLFADRLNQIVARARRDNCLVALIYIDLDGFKLVNDSLGHPVGDLLLRKVSERLLSRIRTSDTLARLGGDEFTVVLSRIERQHDAELVANTLIGILQEKFLIEGHEINIGASIGISLFPEHGTEPYELLQQADSAMYAAKRNGKNQYKVFTQDLGVTVRERLILENQLRSALDDGEIEIHYQPEYDVVSNRVVRFEALARWMHPTLGNIPPGKFIPIAEESGLIFPLGEYVMEKACRDALKWQSSAHGPVQVAVNVSNIQFSRDSFVDTVLSILERTQLPPNLLQLELTESATAHSADRARKVIARLREVGVSVAIDDFGTGYSSLSYLPKLAFDALKIDRSFITDIASRPDTKAMVQSLITLAHNFGMRVIIEGVETQEQLEIVRALGSNEVQGFYFGRPTNNPMVHLATPDASLSSKVKGASGRD